jgi:hypothetical protein
MELEARPEPKRPVEAVRRHLLGFDHLTLRLQLGVHTIKRVPHQETSVARDKCSAPDRIKIGKIGTGHETKHARRGTLRDRRCCKRSRRCNGTRASNRF